MDNNSVLVMIVGTGGKDNGNYLNILVKEIEKANSSNLLLIYSQNEISKKIVSKIYEQFGSVCTVKQFELPEKGMEFHADECYKKFDNLLKEYADKRIVLNITHGTKAMSAALYAVGLHYNITDFQYGTKKTNEDGSLDECEEIIEIFDASYARWQGILKQCRTLFEAGQYAAVKGIISNEKTSLNEDSARDCITLSEFCSAWDRFDYYTALNKLDVMEKEIPELNYKYNSEIEEFLNILAEDEISIDRAKYLMFDLYANGRRRLKNAQYEDAGVRAYRMAELLGQMYLMKNGYQSNKMPARDSKVRSFADLKGLRPEFEFYRLGRSQVIDFLEQKLNYDPSVINFLRDIERKVRDLRNQSILIHGYTARANSSEKLKSIFNDLLRKTKDFITEKEFNRLLQSAMFLNNNFKVQNDE